MSPSEGVPRGSSRAAFVQATAALLRRQGYHGTGLNEIVARSGAPKGSLYFHFPGGKEELAAAAMAHSGDQLRGAIARALAPEVELDEALGRLVDSLALGLERSGYQNGCPIATATLEAAAGSEPLRAVADAVFTSWLEVLAERFAASGLDPEAASRRATLVLAAIEGALILARARGSVGPLTAVRDELVHLLG
ncbi:MAG: TetR/AcrR family transcriptional regulator [Solirubrobacteraceae bacterium]